MMRESSSTVNIWHAGYTNSNQSSGNKMIAMGGRGNIGTKFLGTSEPL
jgi:hypothetical protein